jgi:hypothetical protein
MAVAFEFFAFVDEVEHVAVARPCTAAPRARDGADRRPTCRSRRDDAARTPVGDHRSSIS